MGKIMPNFLQRSPKYEPQPRKWERGVGVVENVVCKKNSIGEDKRLPENPLRWCDVLQDLTGHSSQVCAAFLWIASCVQAMWWPSKKRREPCNSNNANRLQTSDKYMATQKRLPRLCEWQFLFSFVAVYALYLSAAWVVWTQRKQEVPFTKPGKHSAVVPYMYHPWSPVVIMWD